MIFGASPAGALGHSGAPAAADTIEVTLAAPEGGAVAEGATGHFAQGETGARIALSALDDGILDPGETVVLALAAATGPGAVVVDETPATATIADDGTVTVSLAPEPDTVAEGGVWSSAVTMSAPVADRVSVRWWTSDGTALAGRDS